MEIGESKTLTFTITPENATEKNIIWSSSDESIATINSEGKIIAKKAGVVDIIATASNDIQSTINIKEEENTIGRILTVGTLGGGGYLGYSIYKKSKKK